MIDFLYTIGIAATAAGIIFAVFFGMYLLVRLVEYLDERKERKHR